ncbi:hypothetical protein [Streptomyces althioticus]|uniref:hypothetical protein n=1 Tax=Streptomyces althioticus TaxID=83380 RepID=UPI003872B85C
MIRQVVAVATDVTSHGSVTASSSQCQDGPSPSAAHTPPPCTTSSPRPTAREKPCARHTRGSAEGGRPAATSSTGRRGCFRPRADGPPVFHRGTAGLTEVTLHSTATSGSSSSSRATKATSAPVQGAP